MTSTQAKQDRKALRRAKKALRNEPAMLCPPDAAGRSFKIRLFGTLCRALIIFCATGGLCGFLCDAFYPGMGSTAVAFCALFSLFFALISFHPIATLAGIVGLAGHFTFELLTHGNELRGVIGYGFNMPLDALYNRGFYSVIKLQWEGSFSLYADAFISLFAFLLTLLFAVSLIRRAHIVAPALFSTAFIVLVFTFNMPVSNASFTFMLSGFVGALILFAYDLRYNKKHATKNKDSEDTLFAEERPPMPEGYEDRAARRAREKEEKKAEREAKLAQRSDPAYALPTVEDELTDYFRTPQKKAKKKSVKEPTEGRTAAARKARRAQLTAVRAYDRITAQSRAAMGGFAGIAMTVLALLILWIPSVAVTDSLHTIDKIDRRVASYREYVTAKLRGNDPVLDLYEYLETRKQEEPHSTTATTQEFKEIPLFRVGVQHGLNLYFTSWIGTDYENGAWTAFTDDQYYSYRDLVGDDIQSMPAEEMRTAFLSCMASNSLEDAGYDYTFKYTSHETIGYATYMVNIRRLSSFSNSLLLPRATINTGRSALRQYRSMEYAELPYAVVFDGITSGHQFNEPDVGYSAIAQVTNQKATGWESNVATMIAAYEASRLEMARFDEAKNKRAFDANYAGTRYNNTSLAKTYIEAMTPQERKDFNAQFAKMDAYTDFVYDTYLDKSDSEIIRALANEIYAHTAAEVQPDGTVVSVLNFAGAADRSSTNPTTYVRRHRLTMAVIDRLVQDCRYTLEITAESDSTLDGVENFLTVTHEGYCVQFASAAALILRELGVPVRYMEGYLCSDFTYQGVSLPDDVNRYTATIRDSNAHAWIEVFYDGIGWIPYETTPEYYISMYGESSRTAQGLIDPDKPDPGEDPIVDPHVTPDEPDQPDVDPEDPEKIHRAQVRALILRIVKIAAIVLGVALVLGVILWQLIRVARAARRAEEKRQKMVRQILDDDAQIFDSEETRAEAARTLCRMVLQLLALYGTAPEKGELKDEYARRLSFAYEDVFGYPAEYSESQATGAISHEFISTVHISELMEAISAEEFGNGMTKKNMQRLAEFYLSLRKQEERKIPYFRRKKLHYIAKVI